MKRQLSFGAAMAAMTILTAFHVSLAAGQESAADCADIEDDRERLECFDRFFSGAPREAGTDDPVGATSASSTAPAAERRRAEPVADRASRAAPANERRTAATQRAPDAPASREERFGLSPKVLDLGGEEMSSVALGEFSMWRRGQKIRLENGQVWEITNPTDYFYKVTNPKVTIEKGLFSSFYLHIEGVSKSLRVKRIR